MFNNYNSSGKHMICDLKEIKNLDLLNSRNDLNLMLKKICSDNEFIILNESMHSFEPIGCSIIYLLSESHISIHTFPEKNHMSFDIYTCRQYKTNNEYCQIYTYLLSKLEASASKSFFQIIDRYF